MSRLDDDKSFSIPLFFGIVGKIRNPEKFNEFLKLLQEDLDFEPTFWRVSDQYIYLSSRREAKKTGSLRTRRPEP